MREIVIGQRALTIEDVINASYQRYMIVIDNDTVNGV